MDGCSTGNTQRNATSPLADGRHLGFVSVWTLVASAAGFSARDARSGAAVPESHAGEGSLRLPEAEDGLEEGKGSFSFCSNCSKRFNSNCSRRSEFIVPLQRIQQLSGERED